MVLGLILGLSTLSIELEHRNVVVATRETFFRDESFSTSAAGVTITDPCTLKLKCGVKLLAGYENHYRSKYYAESYAVMEPSLSLEFFSKTPFSGMVLWTPGKFFHRMSPESEFRQNGFRNESTFAFSVRYDLQSTKTLNFFKEN